MTSKSSLASLAACFEGVERKDQGGLMPCKRGKPFEDPKAGLW